MTFGTQTSISAVAPQEKLARMGQQLAQHQLDGYYVSPEDEHLNEYLPDCKKRIEWLSGFTGESAPLLATPQKLHLYVDGRFHLQVDDEVDSTVVEAIKLGPDDRGDERLAQTVEKLATAKPAGQPYRLGYDPFLVSPRRFEALKKYLTGAPVTLVPVTGNLIDPTWSERPPLPPEQAYAVDETWTGRSLTDKLASIRADIKAAGAEILPVTRLDDVAWLFNIRAKDIPYNPVLESYALLTPDKAILFAPPEKIPAALKSQLVAQGVTLAPYEAYQDTLRQELTVTPRKTVLVDKDSLTLGTLALVEALSDTVCGDNPITGQKAIKNATEIDRMLAANYNASRAIIRHLVAMEKAFAAGQSLSEVDVRADLEQKYQEEPGFVDLSFPTIPGIGTNSAIIHYSKADPLNIGKAGDWYLLDSGCQYQGGTTDTTRTTVFGAPRPDQIQKYTAVLKAHIGGASLVFPDGTRGAQIDACTRQPMWNQGLDFAHGTGHGVGAFLNVHEGPNRISKAGQVPFQPGMVTSIEPGYYEKDWGGIRLENLYYVAEDTTKTPFLGKKWYRFEPLTFAPFDKKLIDIASLTAYEQNWLSQYNQSIWDKLHASLSPEEQAWLKDQCTL